MERKSKEFFRCDAPSWLVFQDPLLNGLIQLWFTLSQIRRKLLATVNEKHPKSLKNWCARWRKFRMHYLKTCWIWISNTGKRSVLIQAEKLKYMSWVCELRQSARIKSTREIFREFLSFRESLFTLFARKPCGAGKSLELPMCLDNTNFGLRKARHLSFPKKATELWFWQFFIGI